VDKYEYNIKADQIMKLIDRRDFKTAAKIADGIDWRRVRNINMLTNVGCVYQAVARYTDAKEIFELARSRAPLGRRLVYQMADVCIDAGEFEEAERYIQEFSELAPKDTGRFELLYQLSKRKGEPVENQIAILEEFKKQDFDEKWAYELARLYHKAGYAQKCIAACDELMLWFGEGQYVDKAMELKMLYVPLSPSQQEKYNMRLKKAESVEPVVNNQREAEPEPMPVLKTVSYNSEKYNTENLQAALAKSMQEIMEAEERYKSSFPINKSYLEEYQSEQEEKEAMFAATRDMRREREKFKQVITETDAPFMAAINLSNATVMNNILIQEPVEEKTEFPEEIERVEQPFEQDSTGIFTEASKNFWEKEEEEPEEEQEEESEYEEVPFSLGTLDGNEIPPKIYYCIPEYNPQPYLDKAADRMKEEQREQTEEETLQSTEPEEQEELEEQTDFEEDYEEDYEDDFPEQEEDFFLNMMIRNYGVEELPDNTYYSIPGYIDKAYQAEKRETPAMKPTAKESFQSEERQKKPEAIFASEDFESEEEDTSEYIYGVEELPEGTYYQVAGYDPTAFLAGYATNQNTIRTSVPKQQKKVQPPKMAEPVEYLDDIPTEEPITEQTEEPPKAALELTPEYKNTFASYLHMPGVEQQIAEILYESEQIGEEKETSLFGNVLIMGEVKSGKTTLAVSLIKTMNHLNGRKGRKIAKISGDRLNSKGIRESIARLAGADLIIEHAGEMRVATATELVDAMKDYTGGMIVVLEDTRSSIERLLADVPQIGTRFTHTIELKECNIAEWAEAAKQYAEENNYIVDDMAMLALSVKIDGVYASKKNIQLEDVQDIIDDAITKAEKRNRKLFGRIFSKKKDSEPIVLRESDFD